MSTMSEYRVRINTLCECKFTKEEDDSLDSLPDFIRERIVGVDLFAKYRMNDAIQMAQAKAKHVAQREKNESTFGDRYFFWKEETKSSSAHAVTVKIEPTVVVATKAAVVVVVPVEAPAYVPPKQTVSVHRASFKRKSMEEIENTLPANKTTVALARLQYSTMACKKFKGVFYAVLITHSLKHKKKDTNVAVSKNPAFTVMCHNNQAKERQKKAVGVPRHSNVHSTATAFAAAAANRTLFPFIVDKDTATAAPHWRLDTVLGPFLTREKAIECCLAWVNKTRGTGSKREKACELAPRFSTSRFSSQIRLADTGTSLTRRLFEMNVPMNYIEKVAAVNA